MTSRPFLTMLALILAGCADVDSLELTCHGLANDGGAVELDGGGEEVDSGSCPPPEPIDACDTVVEGTITNSLDGTCWWEQCRDGERSLFMKPPGVPCVYRYATGDFAIGSCDLYGVCTDGSGTGQPD